MADNTTMNPGTGGDLISSDELTTINGGAAPGGLKVQRKNRPRVDGDLNDATTATPVPVASFTVLTPASPTSVSVGTSSASAIAANSARKGLVAINLSSSNIPFGLGSAATLNQGITLVPFGTWVMDQYTFTTAQIFAIAGVASSNLSVQEFS